MPKPQRHVFVCTQSRPPGHPRGSCGERGCATVAEAFFNAFQQRNLWGTHAVTTSGCMGPCTMGPNVLVYPEGVLYTGVSTDDVDEIIDKHILGGEPVERLLAPAEVW